MLWMKAWLETRWRLLFGLGITLVPLAFRHLTSAEDARRMMGAVTFLLIFNALYLGGTGIRTQAAFQATKGLHGSTFFTLSLPVSRLRLLAVRVGVGLLETAGVILIVVPALWLKFPLVRENSTPMDLAELVLAGIVCTACFHFISTLSATVLDETWQVFANMLMAGLSWWAAAKLSLPPSADIFRFMGDASPLVTHRLPWTAMGLSICAAALLFLAAWKVVQNREY